MCKELSGLRYQCHSWGVGKSFFTVRGNAIVSISVTIGYRCQYQCHDMMPMSVGGIIHCQ